LQSTEYTQPQQQQQQQPHCRAVLYCPQCWEASQTWRLTGDSFGVVPHCWEKANGVDSFGFGHVTSKGLHPFYVTGSSQLRNCEKGCSKSSRLRRVGILLDLDAGWMHFWLDGQPYSAVTGVTGPLVRAATTCRGERTSGLTSQPEASNQVVAVHDVMVPEGAGADDDDADWRLVPAGISGCLVSDLRRDTYDCISGDTPVRMGDGGQKAAGMLCAGDVVFSPELGAATAIVATVHGGCDGGGSSDDGGDGGGGARVAMVGLPGGGWITAEHPVRPSAGEKWARPSSLSSVQLRPLGKTCLCNFVLEAGHSIEAGGIEVAAMGHDSELGISPPHAFYGVEAKVLQAMRALPGYPDVVLPRGSLLSASQRGRL
jgi:hypothetical protein